MAGRGDTEAGGVGMVYIYLVSDGGFVQADGCYYAFVSICITFIYTHVENSNGCRCKATKNVTCFTCGSFSICFQLEGSARSLDMKR